MNQGLRGVISVLGVKYTTARDVAEKVVDRVVAKLGAAAPPCRTRSTAVYGGAIGRLDQFMARATEETAGRVSPETTRRLVSTYGSNYPEVLQYCREHPEWSQPVVPNLAVIKAEVVHAVRAEMAQTLADVVLRRTELGTAGYPGDDALRTVARTVADEMGWDESRIASEMESVRAEYARVGVTDD
jgi:glycerol-3-phosphate dehydrogenase